MKYRVRWIQGIECETIVEADSREDAIAKAPHQEVIEKYSSVRMKWENTTFEAEEIHHKGMSLGHSFPSGLLGTE